MDMWREIVGIAESISLSAEHGAIIWKFNSNWVYSVPSLYAIVNFRGVKSVYPTPCYLGALHSPYSSCLLWLLSNNKLLTRDN